MKNSDNPIYPIRRHQDNPAESYIRERKPLPKIEKLYTDSRVQAILERLEEGIPDWDPGLQERLSQLKISDVMENRSSGLTEEQLAGHFIQKLKDRQGVLKNFGKNIADGEFVIETNLLCAAYGHSQERRPLERAIFTRFLNIRALPLGREWLTGKGNWNGAETKYLRPDGWKLSYQRLPAFLALDIDGDKTTTPFRRVFGWGFGPEEIVEKLGLPEPLFLVINPITENAHIVWEIAWTDAEWNGDQAAVEERYNALFKKLSWLTGADPTYNGHSIRSPFFLPGHHRTHPEWKTCSRERINLKEDSIYHRSIWFNPRAYSLAKLEEAAEKLMERHQRMGNTEKLKKLEPLYSHTTVYKDEEGTQENNPTARKTIQKAITAVQAATATIERPQLILEGNRNISLRDWLRNVAYRLLDSHRNYLGNKEALIQQLEPIALEWTARMPEPEPRNRIRATVRSVARFTIRTYKPPPPNSSQAAIAANQRRWKRWNEWNTRKPRPSRRKKQLETRRCENCSADISHLRADAKTCSERCRLALWRKKADVS